VKKVPIPADEFWKMRGCAKIISVALSFAEGQFFFGGTIDEYKFHEIPKTGFYIRIGN